MRGIFFLFVKQACNHFLLVLPISNCYNLDYFYRNTSTLRRHTRRRVGGEVEDLHANRVMRIPWLPRTIVFGSFLLDGKEVIACKNRDCMQAQRSQVQLSIEEKKC
jgi:hypothetical protein